MIYYLDLWSSTLRVIAQPLPMKRENTFQTIYIFEKICSGQILYEEIYYDLTWLLTNITAHFYIQATFNGWSISQMRQWVGEICFEQGFTEKCDLTFYFFFIWIRLLHIHYQFKLYEGNLIQIGSGEHKIYSEHDFDIGETTCNKSPTNQGNIIMRSMHGPQQPPKYNATL